MLATSVHTLFLLFYYFLLLVSFVAGVPQTRFIDDQHGESPRFTGQWDKGPACKTCLLRPNPALAFGGTWSDITHHKDDPVSFIEITFAGTAIDVFCIIPNSPPNGVVATYDLKFTLDDRPVHQFYNEPSKSRTGNSFSYNVSVFSIDGLDNIPHKLVLNTTSTTRDSAVLFDYAKYTYDDIPSTSAIPSPRFEAGAGTSQPPTRGHRTHATIIAASVLAPLFFISAIILFILYGSRRFGWRLHQHKQQQPSENRYRLPPPQSTTTTTLPNPDNGFTMRIHRWALNVAGQRLAHPFSPPSEVPSTCRSQESIPRSREQLSESFPEKQPRTPHPPKKWIVCNPSSSSDGNIR